MNTSSVKHLLLALALAIPVTAFAIENAAAIQVNDETIPADEVNLLMATRPTADAKDRQALEQQVREQLIVRQLFAQEARKAKIDKTPSFATKLRMVKEDMLAREYQVQYVAQHPPAEADLRAAYAAIQQRAGNTEYHLRQIFVASEADAKAVIKRLDAGERFDTLATTLSKDENSRAKGGDLGWLSPLQLLPSVTGVVAALKKGEFTHAPVQERNGWHVVQVEDSRPYAPPTYEQLLPQLKRALSTRMLQARLAELRKQAKVR
ncbi:MAG: hypothetical protein D4S02_08615 [Rhodocyclaceae bacterium]|nr:MAG: hypothetical protein D4S02_08615 [Rhodocyclaceae bacterium]